MITSITLTPEGGVPALKTTGGFPLFLYLGVLTFTGRTSLPNALVKVSKSRTRDTRRFVALTGLMRAVLLGLNNQSRGIPINKFRGLRAAIVSQR